MEGPLGIVASCNYCTVKHPCIDRRPFNTMQISKPVVINILFCLHKIQIVL